MGETHLKFWMLWKINAVFLHDIVLQLPELRIPLLLLCMVLLYGDVDDGSSRGPRREKEGRKLYKMRPLAQ